MRYVAPPWHYVAFLKGVVDTRDVVYFVVTTCAILFLALQALELRRWR